MRDRNTPFYMTVILTLLSSVMIPMVSGASFGIDNPTIPNLDNTLDGNYAYTDVSNTFSLVNYFDEGIQTNRPKDICTEDFDMLLLGSDDGSCLSGISPRMSWDSTRRAVWFNDGDGNNISVIADFVGTGMSNYVLKSGDEMSGDLNFSSEYVGVGYRNTGGVDYLYLHSDGGQVYLDSDATNIRNAANVCNDIGGDCININGLQGGVQFTGVVAGVGKGQLNYDLSTTTDANITGGNIVRVNFNDLNVSAKYFCNSTGSCINNWNFGQGNASFNQTLTDARYHPLENQRLSSNETVNFGSMSLNNTNGILLQSGRFLNTKPTSTLNIGLSDNLNWTGTGSSASVWSAFQVAPLDQRVVTSGVSDSVTAVSFSMTSQPTYRTLSSTTRALSNNINAYALYNQSTTHGGQTSNMESSLAFQERINTTGRVSTTNYINKLAISGNAPIGSLSNFNKLIYFNHYSSTYNYAGNDTKTYVIYSSVANAGNQTWFIYNDANTPSYIDGNVTFAKNITVTGNGNIANNLGVTGNITGNNFYGQMYNKSEAGYTLNLVTVDVYENVTGMVAGSNNGFTVSAPALVTQVAGTYAIDWGVTFEGSGEYGGSVFKNGVQEVDCYDITLNNVATNHQKLANNCFVTVSVGDILTVMMDDHTNPVSDPTIHQAHLRAMRVGT